MEPGFYPGDAAGLSTRFLLVTQWCDSVGRLSGPIQWGISGCWVLSSWVFFISVCFSRLGFPVVFQ
ncbi:hypothetical protein RHGRI_001854 [Rhododendron griersonianum]|uniref:Uncharacterized protein n=1 Tax=Rhododendron griersonianum TaxID=479676 RepID=A0AAV6LPB3_9ERIC|nr:hypothetical protein RHGRI_001854 [Rhododendron griersonianum]